MRTRRVLAAPLPAPVVALAAVLLATLAGCAAPPRFLDTPADAAADGPAARPGVTPPTAATTAGLRVVAGLDGETGFVTAPRLACKLAPQRRVLGQFSPDVNHAAQAGRRGFEHKLGLPGAEGLARQVYAEYRVEAGRPLFVRADNVSETGDGVVVPPATYVSTRRESRAVAGFTPQAGHVYELRYGYGRGGPALRLFEVTRTAAGGVAKRPLAFDLGERGC